MIQIDLSGKTALVTGGGQGLGQASGRALHAAGANLVINYFEEGQGANKAKAEGFAEELGERALALPANVCDMAEVEQMIAGTVENFGGLDIVVNNAGILRDRSMKKMTLDEWQAVIDTNLSGVFKVCKAAAPHMNDHGAIINMASIAAFGGFFGQSNYAAAKAGVVALTKVLSKELARQDIRVNAVAPGVVLTDMAKTIPEEARQKMLEMIPLGRFGEADEIAHTVLFLASDLSSYISGQTIHVNGGWM